MNEVVKEFNGAVNEDIPRFLKREVEKKEAEAAAEETVEIDETPVEAQS